MAPCVSIRPRETNNLQKSRAVGLLQKIGLFQYVCICDFTVHVQTVSETLCSMCLPLIWSTTHCKQRLHRRCCDQWSAMTVRATAAWSFVLIDQWCRTSCIGIDALLQRPSKWRNQPDLNPSCWEAACLSVCLNEGDIFTSRRRYATVLRAVCDGASSCRRVHL